MKTPKVSIGIPVHNGEAFLTETVDALLAQTVPDLEIVISDNASRDATAEIAQKFASKDSRVKYSRTDRLLPPAENYNRVLQLSSGRFFKFAADDDLHAPTFLERCLEVLERDPGVVLAYPKVRIIDAQGQTLKDYDCKLRTDAAEPATRFGALVRVNHRKHGAYEIFGLMRAEAIRKIPPQGNHPRADSVALVRLALLGRFHEIPEVLFFSREHEKRSVRQLPDRVKSGRSRLSRHIGTGPVPPLEWWDPTKKGTINFPEWRVAKEYFTSVIRAPISTSERFKCNLQMARWLVDIGVLKLGRDLVIAAEQLLIGAPRTGTEKAAYKDLSAIDAAHDKLK
jgi:glycosyltransferase involved in cell wall biosynthesis